MARVACPYRYHRFPVDNLWFQCTGRTAPGREGCCGAVDPLRQRSIGFGAAAWPVFAPRSRSRTPRRAECPDCGTTTGIRACPVCHTPLPASFADADSPLIALGTQVDRAGVGQFRVDEPLLWLLSHFKIIERSRA
ncbi:hypothetical protein ABT324_31240 [Saccharopolyspora sp. NPDC000359]|uniref:hypothetical protein n=1 Tax=Saccharopolyspora sp. NPDC000359 TaxID=3154251 RepID=UPI003332FCD4